MPELPDIVVYVESLQRRILAQPLQQVRIASPFVLRTFDPPLSATHGLLVTSVQRIGKRIAIGLQQDLFAVIHLMIAGRLRWAAPGARVTAKVGLVAFDFSSGTLMLTEASTQKRASLHVVRGQSALDAMRRGAVEPLECTREQFEAALVRENHTLKRALSDPTVLSGIGNAYSDEILHRAGLSPVRLTRQLDAEQLGRLFEACRNTLTEWTERLRRETGERFPEKVTAFREEMAVHGRFGKPCPACGTAVQRIRHAANEVNYCPRCQTGGKLLADRALSRLLKGDWPRNIDELEELQSRRPGSTEKP